MGAKSVTEDDDSSNTIVDDISNVDAKPIAAAVEDKMDLNKLAALKAKSQAKNQESNKMAHKKKERSLEFGIVGTGQSGGNLASVFSSFGYDAIAINTAVQDLRHLNLQDSNKLFLNYGLGGASKDLTIGENAALEHRSEILNLINTKLSNSQVNIICSSLGGGSGSGSIPVLVDILTEVGKPIIVIAVLPMNSEDLQTKANSLETLAKLASFTQSKKIANLIVIDNAKIESVFSSVSQLDFFNVANKTIVNVIDSFNTFSFAASSFKGIDPMELSKIFLDGEGLSTYGEFEVFDYENDTAIAESIVNNLDNNLLAGGFDLKQSKYVGFILAANKEVWSKIPAISSNYALSMISDKCNSPKGVFRGVYVTDEPSDCVKVYSFFSGLGLPSNRIDELKKETAELKVKVKVKDDQRNLTLNLDNGTNQTISEAEKLKNKIAAKNSTFGKFVSNTVDRRK